MSEEEPSYWGRVSFNPSPYNVNWEKLQQAGICPRKLCLVYTDVSSDRRRKMQHMQSDSSTKVSFTPSIPLGQPSATALGELGEQSVAQKIVSDYTGIEDNFQPEHWSSFPDFGEVDYSRVETSEMVPSPSSTPEPVHQESTGGPTIEIRQLSVEELMALRAQHYEYETPVTPLGRALEKSKKKLYSSIVSLIDTENKKYLRDPFDGFSFSTSINMEDLKPDLQGRSFIDVYPQIGVSSSVFLLHGFVDFLGITPEREILPIEVKNSARPSGKDRFQLLAYLNTLNTGGIVTKRVPVNPIFEEVAHKYYRVRNLLKSITYSAAEELGNRLMRMAKRRQLEYPNIAQLRYENRINIDNMVAEILNLSQLYPLLIKLRDELSVQHSTLRKELLKEHSKIFTRKAMNSIKSGIIVYPRLSETFEVKSNELALSLYLQAWIDCVYAANRGEVLPIPTDPPCGRCGYKQGCEEFAESEYPALKPKPVPILFEAIDRCISNSDVLTKSMRNELTDNLPDSKSKQYIQTRLTDDDDVLNISLKVAKDRRDKERLESHYPYYYLHSVVSEVLRLKADIALEDNNLLGNHLQQWGPSNIQSDTSKYYFRRPRAMYERANVALRYWKI